MRNFFSCLLAASLAVASTGCHRPAPANTVRMLIESSPNSLDPRLGTDAQAERIYSLVFDALVHRNNTFGIDPWVAASWDTPDPLTYIFHLRHDVRFSNGQPLTSRDVKWTFDSMLNGSVITVKSAAYRTWKSVEAPDPFTFVVHLKEPDSSLLTNICDGAVGIIPYGSGADFWRNPIGSGPFTIVSNEQDKSVVLQRNSLFWGQKPAVDGVRFMVVPDAITRALEMQKGSADVVENALPMDVLPALAKNTHLRIKTTPGTVIWYFIFNLHNRYLRDVRVREAIAEATNRPLLVRTLYDGRARVANSVMPPEHWAWTGAVEQHPFDPAKANALLDAAGYKRGADGTRFRITLKSSTDEDVRMLCSVAQSELAQIGIAVDLRSYEFATFYADVTRGAFDMAPSRWVGANEAPDILNYAYSSTRMPPHGANRGYYSNTQVDKLIQDGTVSQDRAQRIADYRAVQQQVAHDLPVMYLWYMDTVAVVNKRLSPLALEPSGNYDFLRTVSISQP